MILVRDHPLLVCCLIISFALASCNILGSKDSTISAGETDIYNGIYTQGIEDSDFNPCLAENESWQFVEIKDTNFVKKVLDVGENPIYMELKGTPSSKGEFKGIYVTYDRKIQVEGIVETESLQEKGC